MADHHHHHHHRPHRLSVPPRAAAPTSLSDSAAGATPSNPPYTPFPLYPHATTTPTPTPSKHRLSSLYTPHSLLHRRRRHQSGRDFSFLLLLLFSLRSLYSILPFLRSSPSFSLFPFAFLVSLLSFLLSLAFSFSAPSSTGPFLQPHKLPQPSLSLSSVTISQRNALLARSFLLAAVFLLRFQALRYCGAAAMILAESSGAVVARFVSSTEWPRGPRAGFSLSKVRGLVSLFVGLVLLCVSWDRIECFPFSASNLDRLGLALFPKGNWDCLRVWPMLLPFLAGFLGSYERVSMDWAAIRQLGGRRIRLISLLFTTVMLFVPAVVSLLVFEKGGVGVSLGGLGWPLANTVVFGVLLSENYSDDNLVSGKDFQKEFLVTFLCTIVLELFYFPELSLWGLLLCGLLLWVAVRDLDPSYLNYARTGSDYPESLGTVIMKPILHILGERKSRKIALFLLINTGYMVVEFVAGFMSNSLGLISDACHMLFDCAALAIGLYASYISRLPANSQYYYGRGRFEVLSGYVNAVFLVLVGALIVLESFERILDPQEISTNSILTISIGGLVVNMVGLVFFHEEHHHAHGGSGSCLHLHPDSHSHHQHEHNHQHHKHVHALEVQSMNWESSLDSNDPDHKSCHGHDNQHSVHDECANCHQHGLPSNGSKGQEIVRSESHCQHHDRAHQHSHHHDNHVSFHNHYREHHHQADQQLHGNILGVSSNSHVPQGHSQTNVPCSVSDPEKSLPSDNKSVKEPHKHHHRHMDHNMEGIFLHVLADTMGSIGVVLSTILIKYKGWLVADPACSIFISVLIISSVLPLLRNSAEILLQRVPRAQEQDLKEALDDVMKIKGVCGVQNLHVWSFTNTDVVGTLHLHVSSETDKASTRVKVSHILSDAGIKDLTLQVESVNNS